MSITPTFPLGVLLAQAPNLSALRMRLFKACSAAEGQPITLTHLDEVDTPGYEAAPSIHWEEAEVLSTNEVTRRSKPWRFACTGSNPGCEALGYYVTALYANAPALLAVVFFPEPRAMAALGDNTLLQVKLRAFADTGLALVA